MSNTIKIQYIRQPAFYSKFHCIGNECAMNCCFGWAMIGWTKNEYEKIKNANMSEMLRKEFEHSFKPVNIEGFKNTFDYQVEYTKDGKCPMLAENGLCMVQKELGEEYLSHTCRLYPRVGKIYNDIIIRTCLCSCNYVIKIICSDKNSMTLENNKSKYKDNYVLYPDYVPTDYINHPVLKHKRSLFEFFYELLSDDTHSIETSIVLASMAARKIDEFVKRGQTEKIPEIIKALKPQLNNPAQIEKLENAKPNLSLKANIAAAMLKLLKGATIYEYVFENGVPNEEKWARGQAEFDRVFGDRPFALRNIALNLFIAEGMPFRNIEESLFDNFRCFAAEMSIIKLLAAAVFAGFNDNGNGEEMFYIAVSNVDRELSHNKQSIKTINMILDAADIKSPAYLLGILK